MNTTLAEYNRLRIAEERAEAEANYWARKIAEDAIAGRPIDSTTTAMYRDSKSELESAHRATIT